MCITATTINAVEVRQRVTRMTIATVTTAMAICITIMIMRCGANRRFVRGAAAMRRPTPTSSGLGVVLVRSTNDVNIRSATFRVRVNGSIVIDILRGM